MHEPTSFPSTRWTDRALIGSVGMFGAGCVLALLVHLGPNRQERARASESSRVALWVTDRDADAVIGLDTDLLRVREVAITAPTDVESRRDGGAWVLSARDRSPLGGRTLIRLTSAGEIAGSVSLGPCLDLATLDGEDALAIEFAGSDRGATRAVRVGADATIDTLFERPGLYRAEASRSHVWLGSEDGSVSRIAVEAAATIERECRLDGAIGDLALGPREGWIWVLELGESRRVVLLDPELDVAWRSEARVAAARIAAVPDEERLWLCERDAPNVRCLGESGRVLVERAGMSLSGIERATAWNRGGALFATPGALLHLDREGRTRPGQGGFRALSDLAVVLDPFP